MIEAYESFLGEPRRGLDEHLVQLAATTTHVNLGWKLAQAVLDATYRTMVAAAVPPEIARGVVFRAAASRRPRAEVLAAAAVELGLQANQVDSVLFADLSPERILQSPDEPTHAASVALRCNLAMAQAALKNSSELEITIDGNVRAVVRHAKLRGLICTVSRSASSAGATLAMSGPLALFRRTALYGRHLAELVPFLPWSDDFELRAKCYLRGHDGILTLTPRDPIPPGPPPRRYDSQLEKRFARDFTRAAPEWKLVREPEPVAAEGTLIFPDFALSRHHDPSQRWLLEIVGFWTAEYLEKKLRRLRVAGIRNLLLCIDATLDCGQVGLPEDCPVLRFRKRIEPEDVLRMIQRDLPARGTANIGE